MVFRLNPRLALEFNRVASPEVHPSGRVLPYTLLQYKLWCYLTLDLISKMLAHFVLECTHLDGIPDNTILCEVSILIASGS